MGRGVNFLKKVTLNWEYDSGLARTLFFILLYPKKWNDPQSNP